MGTSQLQLDPIAIARSLARIEEQNATMIKNWASLEKNLALGPESPLRDSVQREIHNSMKEQHKQCGADMRTVAEATVREAMDEHNKTYHKRDSKFTKSSGLNFETVKPILIFLVKRILPLVLAGGATIGGMEMLNTAPSNPAPQVAPAVEPVSPKSER